LDLPGTDEAGGDDLFYDGVLAPLETRMLRAAWRITRDPDQARDAVQDAMARIWPRRELVRAHPNPAALVLRVAIQAALDVRRRESRRRRGAGRVMTRPVEASSEADPQATAEQRETRDLVLDAIAQLPARQAAAVALRVMDDASYEAIAAALGCAEATARVHVLRGREKLRRLLHALAPAGGAGGGEP
jgi:RNA polymerase sigma factor (sigma-70 family)